MLYLSQYVVCLIKNAYAILSTFHLSVICVAFQFVNFFFFFIANNRFLRIGKITKLNSCVRKICAHIHFYFSQEIASEAVFVSNISMRSHENRLRNDARVEYESTSEYVTYVWYIPIDLLRTLFHL